jgi:asparagine synthase (glutamine-hydrolysing)
MCGICGIKSLNYKAVDLKKSQFFEMLNSLNHRGPDFKGHYINENLYLGSTRLKILDLEDRSNMPMQFDNYIIIFNGEIYNHKELRENLKVSGEVFKTTSDTEVILRLFKNYKLESFKMLDGMFAICIYDIKNKKIILARDIFGIKPLYYSFFNKSFVFSSEIKSIVNKFNNNFEKNYFAIYSYLSKGSIIEPQTQFNNIFSLLPGNVMIIEDNLDYEIKEFQTVCSIIKESENSSISYSKDEFFLELNKQISTHSQSDVPISLMLSSGIDSVYLNEVLKDSVTPFTLSYNFCKDSSNDEIIRIKKNFSLKNHFSEYFEDSDIINIRNNYVKLSDTLSIDGIQFLLISKFIKKNNFKVAMAGFGADEIFNSYPSYKYLKFFNNMKNITPSFIGLLFNFNDYKIKKLKNLLFNSSSLEKMYLNFRSIFFKDEITKILGDKIEEYDLYLLEEFKKYTKDIVFLNNKIKSLEMNIYLRDQVLKDLDWASMKHSLEVRVPFLSKSLLKMSASKSLVNSINKNDLFVYSKLYGSNYFYDYKKKGFSSPDNITKNQRKFVLDNYSNFINS